MALVGLGMVGVGLWFVYWPLALIVPGVGLVGLGVYGARNSAGGEDDSRESSH